MNCGFGKVSALGVDEQRVWIYADFATLGPEGQPDANPENPSGHTLLDDGYRVEAAIVVRREENVLLVPAGALFRDPATDQWSLYVVEDGRARLRAVVTGRGNGLQTRILKGIEEGETVVLHPGDRVTDGARVAPRGS